ncbi:MAG TPA: hypothetical protein VEW45_08760, partial [Candidatus Dormibacteraeota bacterium]|nr:hypothetical protein [Candidatus Dormibacteraeota bacterium]
MADLNEGRLDLARSRPRFIAFGVAAAVLFTILGGRLFQLQVINGDLYAARAVEARTAELAIRAPRGLVFDRESRAMAVNVPSWTVKVRPADLPANRATTVLRRVAQMTGADARVLRQRLNAFEGSPFEL